MGHGQALLHGRAASSRNLLRTWTHPMPCGPCGCLSVVSTHPSTDKPWEFLEVQSAVRSHLGVLNSVTLQLTLMEFLMDLLMKLWNWSWTIVNMMKFKPNQIKSTNIYEESVFMTVYGSIGTMCTADCECEAMEKCVLSEPQCLEVLNLESRWTLGEALGNLSLPLTFLSIFFHLFPCFPASND